ncbi:MAG: ABC transporter permease subunit [Rhizobiaceae bacterium]|nr:ABC transporter permease subunit [Rhizobiaceae bacterium]
MRNFRTLGIFGWIYTWLIVLFVLAPVIIMVPASFGASDVLEFPPSEYSLRWYQQVLTERQWVASAMLSGRIALLAAAIATISGLMVAILHLLVRPVGAQMRAFLMLPIVAPNIVLATGLFSILLLTRQLGSPLVLAIAHASLALPLTMIVLVNATNSIDPLLWTAARTLGAPWWTAFGRVILPLMITSTVVGFVLALIVSWDEVTFAIFIGPSLNPTLPARMFYYLRELITPALTAVATLLVLATIAGALIVGFARRLGSIPAGNTGDNS